MPNVGLRFFANLRRYAPTGRERETVWYDVPAGATAADLIVTLDIDAREDFSIVVGNRIVGDDYVLAEGDQVLLLPAIAGGR